MNKAALKKYEIYNKLTELTEQELGSVADYVDFMRHKKQLEEGKNIRLEGILKGCHIDFSYLKELKEKIWKHVDR